MRTQSHAIKPDRIALPRRLVPRTPQCVLDLLRQLNNPPPTRFAVGDMITYVGTDGFRRCVTILGLDGGNNADVMVYDGTPNYAFITIEELSCLRIIEITCMSLADVDMYRRFLDLPPLDIELEAARS
ncbi:hypothetical protein [Ensifer soli]|uniref:hypothetical protein n=1 Tax=Ciceribacter sp. sgz301302 TaxID=3342379 RepID=UPI0035B93471